MELLRRRQQVGLLQSQALELALQQFLAGLHVARAVQLVEPGAHLVARASAGQVTVGRQQPVAARLGLLAGEDLHAVAAAQLVGQRHDAVVDLGAAAAVPDHGVHVVGEIQRRGALRQVDHLAHRGQRIDPVLDQFGVQRPGQPALLTVLRLFQQLPHPGDLAVEGLLRALAAFLVLPVRGHAQFGLRMHVVGADLHLDRAPFRADHRCVQRAVVVGLGPGDVVVELAGHRRPQRMHHAQRGVAGGDVVDHHPHRAQVVQLVEGQALLLHLPPDAVDVLGPPADLRAQALLGQRLGQDLLDRLDVALARHPALVDLAGDAPVGVRLQVPERQVFQLPFQLPDAQAVGQRRVDVAGQLRQRAALRLRRLVGHAHLRQLPRQQDRHHPQVLHDRQQQPAQAFAVAPGLAPGMQRPHRVGGVLRLQQAGHRLRPRWWRHRQLRQLCAQGRQVEQQRRQQRGLVGRQQRQRVQGVGQHRPRQPRQRLGLCLPGLQQRRAQGGRQGRGRRALQQRLQAGVDGVVQGRTQSTKRCRLH